ncbi:MAG: ACP S-malonyltransferase [Alphaproteobacteria bacterium]|jgi:[acyl-carrier-protein] S-malonyltransferase|nr:ACP S-malonyltransferase [Alphaproteobacteria bacterium]
MRALLFPGQGSQVVGMGKELYEKYTSAKEVFQEVNDVLGFDLTKIIFEGPEEILQATENTQPAIMTCSMAVIKVLEKEFNLKLEDYFSYLAGHSLGEYSALCAAGVFDIKTTAHLLKVRGEAMKSASPDGFSSMVAVIGLDDIAKVQELIDGTKKPNEISVIANDNCKGQTVVSGHKQSIESLIANAKSFGVKLAKELKVSGAFHSPLMITASTIMAETLNEIPMNDAKIPLISNVLATEVSDANQIRGLLVEQVVSKVRWRESMEYLISKGIDTSVEAGNGEVLSGLMKRIDSNVKRINLATPESLENFMKDL